MPTKADKTMRRNVVMIDSSIDWERQLEMMEKRSGFEIFNSIYWGLYLFTLGLLLLSGRNLSDKLLVGISVTILAVFVIVYGFVLSLHYKFLKKHA